MSKFSKIVVGGKKYKQYRNEVEQQMRLLLPIAIRMAMTVSLEDVRMFFFQTKGFEVRDHRKQDHRRVR